MDKLINIFRKKYCLRAFANLTGNLSAALFGLAFVTPNFVNLSNLESLFVLIKDIIFGIVFLLVNVLLEKQISNE